MTWGLGEALVDAVILELQTNLEAKLTALETEYGDGVTLPVPPDNAYKRTEKGLESVSTKVGVGVLHTNSTMNGWGWDRYVNAAHPVRIAVIVIGGNHELLERVTHRLMRAIWEVLNETLDTSGPGGFQITSPPEPVMNFGGVFESGNDFEQSAELALTFTKHENKS